MKLFLASEGSDPQTLKKLRSYIGGFEGKSVVYIPTARNGENAFGTWKEGGTWKFLANSSMDITPMQLEDYKHSSINDIKKVLSNKDIIWVSGGACGYLMYWMNRIRLNNILHEILEKGTLYVGGSAGSMVASSTLGVSEWYIGEPEPGAKYISGLGFVDFDIYPHYNEEQYDEIKRKYTGKKIYLVKNGDVVLVENKKVTVLGEERIITNE